MITQHPNLGECTHTLASVPSNVRYHISPIHIDAQTNTLVYESTNECIHTVHTPPLAGCIYNGMRHATFTSARAHTYTPPCWVYAYTHTHKLIMVCTNSLAVTLDTTTRANTHTHPYTLPRSLSHPYTRRYIGGTNY